MSDDPASKDAFRWEVRRSLVERLRIPWEGMGDMANEQRAQAAIQISTMIDDIECLTRERDEARREACGSDGGTIGEAMLEARQRGWDCFKEKP